MAGRRARILAVLAVAALLAGCDGNGKVECRDGTSHQRGGKGSVTCMKHGGEKWTGDW